MAMLTDEILDEAVGRLVARFQPEAIYLYGSHAYGEPHQDSDVDLYVIVAASEQAPHQRAAVAYDALYGIGVPIEIRIATRDEYRSRIHWVASIERDVHTKGKRLYGTA